VGAVDGKKDDVSESVDNNDLQGRVHRDEECVLWMPGRREFIRTPTVVPREYMHAWAAEE
jgi:hypothetical protein